MKAPRLRLLRRGTQSLGLLLGLLGFTGIGMTHLIFPGLHCYSCPLAVTICPIGLVQNLVANGTVPFYWLGFVALYGLLLGRGWCGWFCPFGTLNDLLSFRKVRFLKALSPLKFAVLLGTVIAAWRFSDTVFCKLCPAGGLEASLPYFGLGVAKPNTPFWIHMATLGRPWWGWCSFPGSGAGTSALWGRSSPCSTGSACSASGWRRTSVRTAGCAAGPAPWDLSPSGRSTPPTA